MSGVREIPFAWNAIADGLIQLAATRSQADMVRALKATAIAKGRKTGAFNKSTVNRIYKRRGHKTDLETIVAWLSATDGPCLSDFFLQVESSLGFAKPDVRQETPADSLGTGTGSQESLLKPTLQSTHNATFTAAESVSAPEGGTHGPASVQSITSSDIPFLADEIINFGVRLSKLHLERVDAQRRSDAAKSHRKIPKHRREEHKRRKKNS